MEKIARLSSQRISSQCGRYEACVPARLRRDAEIGAEEHRAQLGDEFFTGRARVAEALAPEVEIKTARVLGPMRELVRLGGSVALGVPERLGHGQLDDIGGGSVVGHVAAVTDDHTGGGEELLCALDQRELLGLGLGLGVVVSRQAPDLGDVEHGVGLQERNLSFDVVAVRILPRHKMGNSLAESWKESPDGRMYDFKLRSGLKFHNRNPVTADDVKFSFEQYRGTGFKEFQTRVHSSGSTLSSSWSAGR